jgi:hypothetical protein
LKTRRLRLPRAPRQPRTKNWASYESRLDEFSETEWTKKFKKHRVFNKKRRLASTPESARKIDDVVIERLSRKWKPVKLNDGKPWRDMTEMDMVNHDQVYNRDNREKTPDWIPTDDRTRHMFMKNKSFGDSGMWSLEEYVTPNCQSEFEDEYTEEPEKEYIEDFDSAQSCSRCTGSNKHHAANPCPKDVYNSDNSIEVIVDMDKLFSFADKKQK